LIQDEIKRIFELQLANRQPMRDTSATQRIGRLRKLQNAILANRTELETALHSDLKKPVLETGLTEIYQVTTEIKHACDHLHDWLKPKRVPNPAVFLGSQAEIRYEPKGVALIISPWNYPFQLAMSPLVSSIAAGNCTIVKPSEMSSHTSAFIKNLIAQTFPEEEVAVIEGDHTVSTALLELPFHHIFFTGSPAVGKIVMQAAAKHLASVTLELGGKSPVIVDDSCDLGEAARKIAWGKFLNAGQTCVAPDYLLISENRRADFVEKVKAEITKFYGNAAESPDYCKIINSKHHTRITGLIQDAIANGAHLEAGNPDQKQNGFLAPTILTNVPPDSAIMQEEIFGPVLPVLTYKDTEEAIQIVNSRQKPLALYIFSRDDALIERILQRTSSGGVCINEVAVQFGNVELPFGGANHSGTGNSHGFFGFKAFSHERAVLKQPRFGAITFFYPPYTKWMKKLLDWTIKYL
jgi:aldehyde dehydrogenase (NAD+)